MGQWELVGLLCEYGPDINAQMGMGDMPKKKAI